MEEGNGWAIYKPTGEIISVVWEKPSENFVEIDTELATDFVLGNKKLTDYKVSDNPPVLQKKSYQKIDQGAFWALKTLDDVNTTISIGTCGDYIAITTLQNLDDVALYATLKNDPTWLISSWRLNLLTIIDNRVEIIYPKADQYSYYIGYTNET
jgi:hypothetical protein